MKDNILVHDFKTKKKSNCFNKRIERHCRIVSVINYPNNLSFLSIEAKYVAHMDLMLDTGEVIRCV